jgi:hypothetical protein
MKGSILIKEEARAHISPLDFFWYLRGDIRILKHPCHSENVTSSWKGVKLSFFWALALRN